MYDLYGSLFNGALKEPGILYKREIASEKNVLILKKTINGNAWKLDGKITFTQQDSDKDLKLKHISDIFESDKHIRRARHINNDIVDKGLL